MSLDRYHKYRYVTLAFMVIIYQSQSVCSSTSGYLNYYAHNAATPNDAIRTEGDSASHPITGSHAAATAALFTVPGGHPAERAPIKTPQDVMVDVSNSFAFAVLNVHTASSDVNDPTPSNFVFSPCGLTSVLIALYEASDGQSAYELYHAMRLPWDRDVVRIGLRDIHRRLRLYFYRGNNLLDGLTLNRDNVLIRYEYETVLRFYGYDLSAQAMTFAFNQTTPSASPPTQPPTHKDDMNVTMFEIDVRMRENSNTPVTEDPGETTQNGDISTEGYADVVTRNSDSREPTHATEPSTPRIGTTVGQSIQPTTESYVYKTTQTNSEVTTTYPESLGDNPNQKSTTRSIETSTVIVTESYDSTTKPIEAPNNEHHSDSPKTETKTFQPTERVFKEFTTPPTATTPIPSNPERVAPTSNTQIEETTTEAINKDLTSIGKIDPLETFTTLEANTLTVTDKIEYPISTTLVSDKIEYTMKNTENPAPTVAFDDDQSPTTIVYESIPSLATTIASNSNDNPTSTIDPVLTVSSNEPNHTLNPPASMSDQDSSTTETIPDAIPDTTTMPTNLQLRRLGKNIQFNHDQIQYTPHRRNSKRLRKRSYFHLPSEYTFQTDYFDHATVDPLRDAMIETYAEPNFDRSHQFRTESLESISSLSDGTVRDSDLQLQFHVSRKETIDAPFKMFNTFLRLAYVSSIQASVLELPLDSDKYILLLMLPDEAFGLNAVLRRLTARVAPTIREIRNGMKQFWIKATIPNFYLKGNSVLTSDLMKLGIKSIFEPSHADFSPMTDERGIYAKHIEQMVSINIRTHANNLLRRDVADSKLYKPIEVFVQQPFIFCVVDQDTDLIIMMGQIRNPLNSRIL